VVIDKKKAAEVAGGTAYWDGILDKLKSKRALRIAWRWPHSRSETLSLGFFRGFLIVSLRHHDQITKNGDMAVYVPLQEKVLQRYMKQEER